MPPEQAIPVNAAIESFIYEKRSDSWLLTFSESITVTVYSLWRLLKTNRIIAASPDHGHPFGLTSPLTLAEQVLAELRREPLVAIEIKSGTGDLNLKFTNGYLLEVLVTPMDYECYELCIGGQRFIATGGGQ